MRTEEEILSGVIEVRMGGIKRSLPVLRIKALREWKQTLTGLGSGFDVENMGGLGDVGKLADVAGDKVIELVMAYDREHALGTREQIEDAASDEELYLAFRKMLETAFPFAKDLATLASMVGGLQAVVSQPASSTNGHSPTGVSTQATSKKG